MSTTPDTEETRAALVARLESAREVCRIIEADLETDTAKWEGAELTGANVAEMFGELRATVQSLAKMIEILLDTEIRR